MAREPHLQDTHTDTTGWQRSPQRLGAWGLYVLETRLSKTLIPLGLMFSQEGPYAAVGETMFRGAQLAVSQIAEDDGYDFGFDVRYAEPGGRNEGYVAAAQDLLGELCDLELALADPLPPGDAAQAVARGWLLARRQALLAAPLPTF